MKRSRITWYNLSLDIERELFEFSTNLNGSVWIPDSGFIHFAGYYHIDKLILKLVRTFSKLFKVFF